MINTYVLTNFNALRSEIYVCMHEYMSACLETLHPSIQIVEINTAKEEAKH